MAYIRVDHSKFTAAASQVDAYITTMKTKMRSANGEIKTLSSSWQGSDFVQFMSEWDKVDNKDSTYNQMLKTLESYSKFLKYAASRYKDAQARAVNRANALPRY